MRAAALMLLLVCATQTLGLAQSPPGWWDNPIREDADHIFQVGRRLGAANAAEALEGAIADAVDQITLRVAGTREAPTFSALRSRVGGWSVYARNEDRGPTGYAAWVLVKYPKSGMEELRNLVRQGPLWYEEAAGLGARGDWAAAIPLLEKLVATYPPGESGLYDSAPALLLLAEACERQHRLKDALAHYQRAARLSGSADSRRIALEGYNRVKRVYDPRLDGLDYLAGKSMALRVVWSDGAEANAEALRQSLRAAGMTDAPADDRADLRVEGGITLGTPVATESFGVRLYQSSGESRWRVWWQNTILHEGSAPLRVSAAVDDFATLRGAALREYANRILAVLRENKP